MRHVLVALTLLVAAACGGSKAEPESPPPAAETAAAPAEPAPAAPAETAAPAAEPAPAATAPAEPTGPSKPWAEMTGEEKGAHMKAVVVPYMKVAFQAHDPKEFAEFGCKTCHGPNAKEVKFKMPNPDLPKLNFKDGLKKQSAEHPEMVKFMGEKVSPDMAKLLGKQPFDPKTKQGFGCVGCHETTK